jgi:hypothetical protein
VHDPFKSPPKARLFLSYLLAKRKSQHHRRDVPRYSYPPYLLAIESIRLGRLVRNLDEPQSDYLDPDCQPRREPIIKPHLQYGELQQTAADKNLAALITRLLSASWTKRRKEYTQVNTGQVTTYQLDNSGAWLKEAVKMQTTREWIKESINQGDDIYLVVGY